MILSLWHGTWSDHDVINLCYCWATLNDGLCWFIINWHKFCRGNVSIILFMPWQDWVGVLDRCPEHDYKSSCSASVAVQYRLILCGFWCRDSPLESYLGSQSPWPPIGESLTMFRDGWCTTITQGFSLEMVWWGMTGSWWKKMKDKILLLNLLDAEWGVIFIHLCACIQRVRDRVTSLRKWPSMDHGPTEDGLLQTREEMMIIAAASPWVNEKGGQH